MDITKNLNDSKKESQLLRSELATLEHKATETNNDTLKEIIESISNLEKDFRKMQGMDVDEMQLLKFHMQQLY
jgi:predicted nuclease with TOPRIM domain